MVCPIHVSRKMADGVLYNLASPPDRQQAADANTNLWARRVFLTWA